VGGAAQSYLEWRAARGGDVTPDDVLRDFSVTDAKNPVATNPAEARDMFDAAAIAAAEAAATGAPADGRVAERFPSPPADLKNAMTAGMALYELAGRTTDRAQKNAIIAQANILLAYREQHDSVQPAFTPGRVLPGEVDRTKLMEILTPSVRLPLKDGKSWEFAEFAPERLPARDLNPLTPRTTEYNWGRFEDRWTPILDSFEAAYQDPAAIWPMPGADPLAG
jgi:hypothetical protein